VEGFLRRECYGGGKGIKCWGNGGLAQVPIKFRFFRACLTSRAQVDPHPGSTTGGGDPSIMEKKGQRGGLYPNKSCRVGNKNGGVSRNPGRGGGFETKMGGPKPLKRCKGHGVVKDRNV